MLREMGMTFWLPEAEAEPSMYRSGHARIISVINRIYEAAPPRVGGCLWLDIWGLASSSRMLEYHHSAPTKLSNSRMSSSWTRRRPLSFVSMAVAPCSRQAATWRNQWSAADRWPEALPRGAHLPVEIDNEEIGEGGDQ